MEHLHIGQFEDQVVEAINAFLNSKHQAVFEADQIHFLNNIGAMDVLGLRDCAGVIRGYLGDFSGRHYLGINADGRSLFQIKDNFEKSLNKDDYDPSDLEALIANHSNEAELTISTYGIILNSNKNSETEVLFLNKDYQPLYLNYVRF